MSNNNHPSKKSEGARREAERVRGGRGWERRWGGEWAGGGGWGRMGGRVGWGWGKRVTGVDREEGEGGMSGKKGGRAE